MNERWWLDYVPTWFRSRWPLKRWFWQAEDLPTRSISEALTEPQDDHFGFVKTDDFDKTGPLEQEVVIDTDELDGMTGGNPYGH